MEISQLALAQLSLIAFFMGSALGILYDVLRATRAFWDRDAHSAFAEQLLQLPLPLLPPRRRRKKRRFLSGITFLEDFLFCILAAVALILLFYWGNNGKLRIPVLLCVAIGFLSSRLTLSRPMMRISEMLVFLIESTVRYLLFFALLPFRFVFGRICALIGMIIRNLRLRHEKRVRERYTRLQIQRIEQDACGLIFASGTEMNERKKHGTRKEKTIQSWTVGKDMSRAAGSHLHRRIRKQHNVL
ncbi:MAG: spore cortex biosynthesis protein YabQ [Clostridia bacterium]|nr:spore cortex biosynthesis protein YabQ [Clostridia bacterium]